MGSLVKQIFVLVSVLFVSSRLFEDGHKLTGQDSRPPTTQSPSLRGRSGLGPTLPQAARPGRPVAATRRHLRRRRGPFLSTGSGSTRSGTPRPGSESPLAR